MTKSIADHLGVHDPDFVNVQKEYDEIRKLAKQGLHHLDIDHGSCVLTERWMKTAHKLFIRTALWIDLNPNPSVFNLSLVRNIRVINKSRLEQIVLRANSPFRMDKYKTCMELLQTTLAEELVAMHHIAMEVEEEEIKHHCNQMDSHLANLKSTKLKRVDGSKKKND